MVNILYFNFYTIFLLLYIQFFFGNALFFLLVRFDDHLQVLWLTVVFLLFVVHRLVQYAVFVSLFGSLFGLAVGFDIRVITKVEAFGLGLAFGRMLTVVVLILDDLTSKKWRLYLHL